MTRGASVGGVVLEESWAAPSAGVDATEFRAALRHHPNGVVVVTTAADGQIAGLTVTSLVSLSLHPPLVCFGISTAASAYPVLAKCQTFQVNFLAAEQAEVAVRFATRGVDRFAPPTRWETAPTGEPVLSNAPARMRCEVVDRLPAGDHVLIIGRALETATRRPHAPLVYHEGRYSSIRRGRWRWWRRRVKAG
jgi:flavin reductase (DIM6/NTAB) family NADH-FMN oxidoreductase RutF